MIAKALSGDGTLVLTGSGDKTTILWDAASGNKLQTFQGQDAFCVALSGDGKQVLTGSWDGTAILWDAASGKKIQTFLGHTNRVFGVALSNDAKYVLTGSEDKTAILWAVKAAPGAFPPLDPAWLKAVAAMKAEQQVEAVKAELMKRNPPLSSRSR